MNEDEKHAILDLNYLPQGDHLDMCLKICEGNPTAAFFMFAQEMHDVSKELLQIATCLALHDGEDIAIHTQGMHICMNGPVDLITKLEELGIVASDDNDEEDEDTDITKLGFENKESEEDDDEEEEDEKDEK